ncbi:uncharacterized protein LOC116341714 [Contarinia nasturtii]|uniref:uncharacterized protein LOC116341714 n=1 Tax=Contarinia nasturtii TaxID=265458 RepID=UPI0012D46F45|nr:uncharacterized protein LOC116341714 [Contarinia nasturtii]
MKVYLCMFVIISIVLVDFVYSASEENRPGASGDKPKPIDAWHTFWNPNICCDVENKYFKTDFHGGIIKSIDECYQQFGPRESGEPPKYNCYTECVANKTGLLNSNGSLNETNYKDFITKYSDPFDHQKVVVNETVTECVNAVKSEYKPEFKDRNGCRLTGHLTIHCAIYSLIESCPTDKESTSKFCRRFFSKRENAQSDDKSNSDYFWETFWNPNKCCNIEKKDAKTNFHKGVLKLVDECYKRFGRDKPGEPTKYHCYTECIANKTGLLNTDGTLNETNYKDFITKYADPYDHHKAVVNETVAECVNAVKFDFRSEYKDPRGCRKTGHISIDCAISGLIGSCPVNKQSTYEGCKKFFPRFQG